VNILQAFVGCHSNNQETFRMISTFKRRAADSCNENWLTISAVNEIGPFLPWHLSKAAYHTIQEHRTR
jgi:hypothetical protein